MNINKNKYYKTGIDKYCNSIKLINQKLTLKQKKIVYDCLMSIDYNVIQTMFHKKLFKK